MTLPPGARRGSAADEQTPNPTIPQPIEPVPQPAPAPEPQPPSPEPLPRPVDRPIHLSTAPGTPS